jgi:predicted lipoprotein with Yx(FWY)xxD motif
MRKPTVAVLAALIAACGPGDSENGERGEPIGEEPEVALEDTVPTPVGLLGVDSLPAGGAYLTDPAGRALYTLEDEDEPGACVDACAQAWPPYTRADVAALAATVSTVFLQPELVGSVARADGSSQVTYDGKPLYYYARDTGPGQTSGQDVTDEWGEWYLVQPSGDVQDES